MKNNLKLYRVQEDLTQEQLATIIGLSRESVLFIEKGKHYPSIKIAMKFARFFKVKVDDIFYWEG
ncbi:MAG: helix-turn-helix transcriptional regulator [Candidatus Diapherotrites archaeon]|uniref:Helix-turn-helix transcriptional regulator n=1 Tax=Candidatus Iainarchaeum sp. TaxID=3101447 RepID=A0A8T5GFT8_9ARCH|nr:helix-turn-helix transcriptional regulator [Candidatus Diapherotrites archaeon]MBT7241313.1 helix-turn-helix transcriptional regulator [Candidatus Diapherotrites archaeon]